MGMASSTPLSCSLSGRCYSFGAVAGYARAVGGANCDTVTFFVGSLFFTSAAFDLPGSGGRRPQALDAARRRFFVFQPGRID
jgi:hypothetical protein